MLAESQDLHDMAKCVQHVRTEGECQQRVLAARQGVVVLGALSGRIDQTFQNINALFVPAVSHGRPIFLVDAESLAFALPPVRPTTRGGAGRPRGANPARGRGSGRQGTHTVRLCRGLDGPSIGLIPVGEPCLAVSTAGLQWDMGARRPFWRP